MFPTVVLKYFVLNASILDSKFKLPLKFQITITATIQKFVLFIFTQITVDITGDDAHDSARISHEKGVVG